MFHPGLSECHVRPWYVSASDTWAQSRKVIYAAVTMCHLVQGAGLMYIPLIFFSSVFQFFSSRVRQLPSHSSFILFTIIKRPLLRMASNSVYVYLFITLIGLVALVISVLPQLGPQLGCPRKAEVRREPRIHFHHS